jgi:succinoglycan biosynthesis protein ExoM
VPTFRRPALLLRLLEGLAAQRIDPAGVEVVVLDNDREPSARDAVAEARERFPFRLQYLHVAEPGLSTVRNAALAFAHGRCDVLAMIDDDECPEPQWLAELLRIQALTGADAVVGPVPQLLPPAAPRWLRSGRFLDLPVFPDGAPIDFGYSGNCLLVLEALQRFALTFDPTFNFAGGEDMLFFRQLRARGGRLAFAAKAIASESIGAERTRAAFVLRLYFRRGNTLALCDRRLGAGPRRLALRAGKAYARLALGSLTLLPLTVVRGRAGAMNALCNAALGIGALWGLLGHTYDAYRRSDPG